ncbi:MAG: DNA topoisomerase III, partial [Myxococcota bacterium]
MRRLVIAEKPSVARDLARVLGANQKRKGYLEGKDWLVTWCIGHLVQLCQPEVYSSAWKRWSLDTLPMIPESFQLQPNPKTADQLNIVK